MVDRINLILKAKNLTSRQFAEEIGIQPSGMSHILGGRNRPSLDFVMKVVNRYPEIDIKWLTLGEGEMYVSSYSMPVVQPASTVQTPLESHRVQPVESEADDVRQEFVAPSEPDLFSLTEPEVVDEQVAKSEIDVEKNEVVDQQPQEQLPEERPQVDENRVKVPDSLLVAEKPNCRKKRIVKVVILYDDHSFSEYYPE
jgi:transcriptional regulator with XRE-family HTH domain